MCIASSCASRFIFNPSILSFYFDINALTSYFVSNGKIRNKSVSILCFWFVYLSFVSIQQWIVIIDIIKVSRSGDNDVIGIYKKFIKQASKILFSYRSAVSTEFLPVFP